MSHAWESDAEKTFEPTVDDRDYCWVPKDDGWLPAKISKCKSAGYLSATSTNGEIFIFPANELGEPINSLASLTRLPEDLVQMDSVNEISIVYTLVEVRYCY
jgi:hypothetical protein